MRQESTTYLAEWLPWLGRVRFLVITVLMAIVITLWQFSPVNLPIHIIIPLLAGWYALATLYVMLQRQFPEGGVWQAPVQMVLDLALITCVVYITGAQDSYFTSLYLLAILMGSILFSRRGAFLVAGAGFVLLGCVVELSYYGAIPRTAISTPGLRELQS